MATVITGGNAQVGTLNRQFIETITNNNNSNNNNITININVVHCIGSHQHQHQEGVSISGGDVPQVIEALKSIVESCGQTSESTTHSLSEAAIKSDSVLGTQSRNREVRKRRGEDVPRQQTEVNTVTASVRIVDSRGRVLDPGDAVFIINNPFSVYVGDGYVVHYNTVLRVVVKEKLNLTQPFSKMMRIVFGNVNVFPPEQRVQRALQHVGKPCPVQAILLADFVCWTYTGLNYEQSFARGFRLNLL